VIESYEGNVCHIAAVSVEVAIVIEDGGLIAYVRKALGKG